jgi:hypothetical protein
MTTATDTARTVRYVRIAGQTLGRIAPLPNGDWTATLILPRNDVNLGAFDSVRQARKAIVEKAFNANKE